MKEYFVQIFIPYCSQKRKDLKFPDYPALLKFDSKSHFAFSRNISKACYIASVAFLGTVMTIILVTIYEYDCKYECHCIMNQ